MNLLRLETILVVVLVVPHLITSHPIEDDTEKSNSFDLFSLGSDYWNKMMGSGFSFDVYDDGELFAEINAKNENPDVKLNVVK